MIRTRVFAGLVALALLLPVAAFAHEGHAHKVMGTIETIAGNHLTVKTTDGKSAMVMVDAKTKITRGKAKLAAAALKVGDRIVAEGPESKEMVAAATIKVGEVAAVAAK